MKRKYSKDKLLTTQEALEIFMQGIQDWVAENINEDFYDHVVYSWWLACGQPVGAELVKEIELCKAGYQKHLDKLEVAEFFGDNDENTIN